MAAAESIPNCRLSIHRSLKRERDHAAAMDTMSLIGALIGAQTGMLQLAVAARLARMNSADMSGSIAQLVGSADQNANALANVAGNVGTNLDVSA
jgi:hypothetical protein